MSERSPLVLVVLPPERAGLVHAVLAAGGTPLVDLHQGSLLGPLPAGAWVRVQEERIE